MSEGWLGVRALLELLERRRCPGCDLDARSGQEFCPACAPLLEHAENGAAPDRVAAFVYGGPVADAIHRLKYGGRAELCAALAHALALESVRFAGKVDRVIPVPLHRARLLTRGFNQSALLAASVARALSIPLDTRTLRRVRATREQAGLGRLERAANVDDAFRSRPAAGTGVRVLLVDDVETTGATLSAARHALEVAGFVSVSTLALARAGIDRL